MLLVATAPPDPVFPVPAALLVSCPDPPIVMPCVCAPFDDVPCVVFALAACAAYLAVPDAAFLFLSTLWLCAPADVQLALLINETDHVMLTFI